MIFKTRRYSRIEVWQRAVRRWHTWFAWYPVRITPYARAWLENVERCGIFYPDTGCCEACHIWLYRQHSKPKTKVTM